MSYHHHRRLNDIIENSASLECAWISLIDVLRIDLANKRRFVYMNSIKNTKLATCGMNQGPFDF